MSVELEARNATLADLAKLLQEQHVAKVDVVAPAQTMRSRNGLISIKGAESQLVEDDEGGAAGVTIVDGVYRPTAIFDEGVADKLGIPLKYVRWMRANRPDLYDANINGLLHGKTVGKADGVRAVLAQPDPRSFFFRGFKGEPGIGRALLSDSYGVIDHTDVLTAALDGVKASGVEVSIDACDLTERRMYVRISAPSVRALAPTLLAGYRSPFRDPAVERANNHGWDLDKAREAAAREGKGYEPGSEPVVWAGFVISNSEVGDGAFSITPRFTVGPCANGLQITLDAIRSVHLGSKLEPGIIRWSEDTQRKALAVVTAKARDAVATFLDLDYLTKAIARLEAKAGAGVSDAAKTIEHIGKTLIFTEAHTAGVLDHFIRGGQMTSGGVMQAVTSYCQTVGDADAAFDLEAKAVKAMEMAYALS